LRSPGASRRRELYDIYLDSRHKSAAKAAASFLASQVHLGHERRQHAFGEDRFDDESCGAVSALVVRLEGAAVDDAAKCSALAATTAREAYEHSCFSSALVAATPSLRSEDSKPVWRTGAASGRLVDLDPVKRDAAIRRRLTTLRRATQDQRRFRERAQGLARERRRLGALQAIIAKHVRRCQAEKKVARVRRLSRILYRLTRATELFLARLLSGRRRALLAWRSYVRKVKIVKEYVRARTRKRKRKHLQAWAQYSAKCEQARRLCAEGVLRGKLRVLLLWAGRAAACKRGRTFLASAVAAFQLRILSEWRAWAETCGRGRRFLRASVTALHRKILSEWRRCITTEKMARLRVAENAAAGLRRLLAAWGSLAKKAKKARLHCFVSQKQFADRCFFAWRRVAHNAFKSRDFLLERRFRAKVSHFRAWALHSGNCFKADGFRAGRIRMRKSLLFSVWRRYAFARVVS